MNIMFKYVRTLNVHRTLGVFRTLDTIGHRTRLNVSNKTVFEILSCF